MSKFDGILSLKPNDGAATKAQGKTPDAKNKTTEAAARRELTNAVFSPVPEEQTKRVGKRSDPEYTQITAYVKKNTHNDVMRKIYKRQEFSELIEELLIDWLKKQ